MKCYLAPELEKQNTSFSFSETEKEINALKEEKAAVFEQLFQGIISQDEFSEKNLLINQRIQETEKRLAECSRTNAPDKHPEHLKNMLRHLYEADELTSEHMQFVKRIEVLDTEHFRIQMQEEPPLAVLYRNVDF